MGAAGGCGNASTCGPWRGGRSERGERPAAGQLASQKTGQALGKTYDTGMAYILWDANPEMGEAEELEAWVMLNPRWNVCWGRSAGGGAKLMYGVVQVRVN